jgi:hypothetical protein
MARRSVGQPDGDQEVDHVGQPAHVAAGALGDAAANRSCRASSTAAIRSPGGAAWRAAAIAPL